MIDFIAAGQLFAEAADKESAAQIVEDCELLQSVFSQFDHDGKIDWIGLSKTPQIVPVLQALARTFLIAVQLSVDPAIIAQIRALLASFN